MERKIRREEQRRRERGADGREGGVQGRREGEREREWNTVMKRPRNKALSQKLQYLEKEKHLYHF